MSKALIRAHATKTTKPTAAFSGRNWLRQKFQTGHPRRNAAAGCTACFGCGRCRSCIAVT